MQLQITKEQAIEFIKNFMFLSATVEERGNILIANNIEDIGDETEGWNEEEIQKQMYNDIVLESYSMSKLVSNKYMESLVEEFYHSKVSIVDEETPVGERCVCCGYIVFYERELHQICPVCKWQDDFSDENEYSHPNRMTLTAYRQKFEADKEQDPSNKLYTMCNI